MTMTTIGLVSAGLLTFPQGLSLVLGANVGTTGTGWVVALIGVRVSLTSYALPLIFIGALAKLLGSGRLSAAGGALAGFALVLYGLTTLQQGMGGLAESMHPSDPPAVSGVGFWSGALGVLALVAAGFAMTAVMQSSTASIAVTLAAHYAGAVGLDQGCALIIGQNIGTATSSAMAAIGASSTAKRLAVAYILFKLIAALIALLLFPVTTPLLVRASDTIDGATLLAAYHMAYNVVGVVAVLPLIDAFTRFVERILPEAGSPLTRGLGPAALATPHRGREGGPPDGRAHARGRVRLSRGRTRPHEPWQRGSPGGWRCIGRGGARCATSGAGIPVEPGRPTRIGRRSPASHRHAARARSCRPACRGGGRGRWLWGGGRQARRHTCREVVCRSPAQCRAGGTHRRAPARRSHFRRACPRRVRRSRRTVA